MRKIATFEDEYDLFTYRHYRDRAETSNANINRSTNELIAIFIVIALFGLVQAS